MIIRVFNNTRVCDCLLEKDKAFTIGSGEADSLRINDSEIVPGHIKLVPDGSGHFIVKTAASVFLNGYPLNDGTGLRPGMHIVLSFEHHIYIVAISNTDIKKEISIRNTSRITIGKSDDNHIAIASPWISRHHAALFRQDGRWYLEDTKSTNGIFVNGVKVTGCNLKDNATIILDDVTISVSESYLGINGGESKMTLPDTEDYSIDAERIRYERAPRLKHSVSTAPITIEAPPQKEAKAQINWVSTLLPAGLSLVVMVVMSAMTSVLFSLPMTIGGVAVSIYNYFHSGKDQKKKNAEREQKYTAYLKEIETEIQNRQTACRTMLKESNPELAEAVAIAAKADGKLWERRPDDSDFLQVSLGIGNIDNPFEISAPAKARFSEEDDMLNRAIEIYDNHKKIQAAPTVIGIGNGAVTGIVGERAACSELIRNMIIRLSVTHSPEELKMVLVCGNEDAETLSFAKDLPHFYAGSSLYAETPEETEMVLDSCAEILRRRENEAAKKNGYFGASEIVLPYYLFIIARPSYLRRNHPVNDYLFKKDSTGEGCIIQTALVSQLPKECSVIVEAERRTGIVYSKSDIDRKIEFAIEAIGSDKCKKYSSYLSRIDCSSEEAAGAAAGTPGSRIPEKYSFYSMFGVDSAQQLNIGSRWKASDASKALSTPIGIGEGDKIIELDMSQIGHGPHGLLAGTTGSGKSEFLISVILGMAVNYSPYDLAFLLIDFKGDGLGMRMRGLPHLLGKISDIDDSSVDRSLKSVQAELNRRKKLFKQAEVSEIEEYAKKYRKGLAEEPLPHLVIMVDEFAELKAQHPEFMKELISAARIGRSLGVHLVLATQKPAGQVSDQIWSNSRFRICLKVENESDSKEVLKSPVSAFITAKGRGYLQVGNNEIFEQFQSGYTGVPTAETDDKGENLTQIQAVLKEINKTFNASGMKVLPDIIVPELETYIPNPGAKCDRNPGRFAPEVGLVDVPEEQKQAGYRLEISGNNVMIVGSNGVGKSNLLQSILRSAAEYYSPTQMQAYIIDFQSFAMKSMEMLPHVGGIVTPAEDEKLKNLFKMLLTEIERRKYAMLSKGVGSIAAYNDLQQGGIPQILLFVENMGMLKERCSQDESQLLKILQEGPSVGISVIATNLVTTGLGYNYLPLFSQRIALFNNNDAEYQNLFSGCRASLPKKTGRCLVKLGDEFKECQTYVAFPGENDSARAQTRASFVSACAKAYEGLHAALIPEIPNVLTNERLLSGFKPEEFLVPIGMDFDTVEPGCINLKNLQTLAFVGGRKEMQISVLDKILKLLQTLYPDRSQVFIADTVERNLSATAKTAGAAGYEFIQDKIGEMLLNVEQLLAARYAALINGNTDAMNGQLIVLIFNGKESMDVPIAAQNAFKNISGKYKNMGVVIMAVDVENTTVGFGMPEILKKVCDLRQALYFDEISNLKLSTLPFNVLKELRNKWKEGEVFFVRDQECTRLKLPE